MVAFIGTYLCISILRMSGHYRLIRVDDGQPLLSQYSCLYLFWPAGKYANTCMQQCTLPAIDGAAASDSQHCFKTFISLQYDNIPHMTVNLQKAYKIIRAQSRLVCLFCVGLV